MKALCGTKRHWETPELADGHRLLLLTSKAAHDPARLHVYRCECGHGYCVGHSRFPIEVRKAIMTIPEFLEKLRQTEGPWTIENGSIRCDDNCPITAVGNGRHAAQYLNIGMDRLGLSMDDVETIAAAADYLDRPLSAQLLAATVRRQHEHS